MAQTILIYRGKNEKHARLRCHLKCKAFKVLKYRKKDFGQFLADFLELSASYFVYPQGRTQADEDWINAGMDKIGFKIAENSKLTY